MGERRHRRWRRQRGQRLTSAAGTMVVDRDGNETKVPAVGRRMAIPRSVLVINAALAVGGRDAARGSAKGGAPTDSATTVRSRAAVRVGALAVHRGGRPQHQASGFHGSNPSLQPGSQTPTSTPKRLGYSACRLAVSTNEAVRTGAGHCWATGHSPEKVGRSWPEANRSGKSADPGPADQEQHHHSPQGGQIVMEANR